MAQAPANHRASVFTTGVAAGLPYFHAPASPVRDTRCSEPTKAGMRRTTHLLPPADEEDTVPEPAHSFCQCPGCAHDADPQHGDLCDPCYTIGCTTEKPMHDFGRGRLPGREPSN